MRQRDINLLVFIILLSATVFWIALPDNPGIHLNLGSLRIDRDLRLLLGLDLQGGLQVLLEADVPADQEANFDARTMEAARVIVENRVNALGVTEPLVQLQGSRRIIVELPGIENPDQAIATLRETGLLEFVEAGRTPLREGQLIRTSLDVNPNQAFTVTQTITPSVTTTPITPSVTTTSEATSATPTPTSSAPITATESITHTEAISPTEYAYGGRVFPTLMTGRHLKDANVSTDNMGQIVIAFELTEEGAQIFRDYTMKHVGDIVAIVLDKRVLSAPVIKEAIPSGKGIISSGQQGGFPLEEARKLAIQMKYGALPVPLKVIENRTIGPTLGQDSVQRSLRAGIIGLIVVLLFMITYYRVPGALADMALVIYALINVALYKLIPVTLTLPAITGFILSTGMAVDANILVFERMKEELRVGKPLKTAMEAGFSRAWTSIRDSNLSTLLTCAILYWFGSNYGASTVKGFAITLALGVLVNLFTAIIVTRTFLRFTLHLTGEGLREKRWLLGT
ncbi:MAG: protein translocase subunit SecD [Ardenticatenia bacterium]|nr:MAG: protein translocase subunit SecD [Ardenticatenia bacterium]